MRKLTADGVQMTSVTLGGGNVTMTQQAGWCQFSDRFANGDQMYYSIRDGNNWEWGEGTYNTGNILVRTTILGTLNAGVYTSGGAALVLASGAAIVRAIIAEELFSTVIKLQYSAQGANFNAADGFAYYITANGVTATLPNPPQVNDRMRFVSAAAAITGFGADPGPNNIEGGAGVLSADLPNFEFTLVWVGGAYGWELEH